SLIILGFGYDNEIGLRLARLPLPDNAAPRQQDTLYYAGNGDRSADVNRAVNSFAHPEKAYTLADLAARPKAVDDALLTRHCRYSPTSSRSSNPSAADLLPLVPVTGFPGFPDGWLH